MHLPPAIVIGPYTYPIVSDDGELIRYEHKAKTLVWGAMQYIEHRILIDPNMCAEKTAVTLLHEVMHGCNDLAGNADLDNEERIVRALAPILLDTLRRNPELIRVLIGDAKE
jgi:hypothetical protein